MSNKSFQKKYEEAKAKTIETSTIQKLMFSTLANAQNIWSEDQKKRNL